MKVNPRTVKFVLDLVAALAVTAAGVVATDRDKYAQVKRSLAKNKWRHVQHDANAKTSIVQEIMKRANSNNA